MCHTWRRSNGRPRTGFASRCSSDWLGTRIFRWYHAGNIRWFQGRNGCRRCIQYSPNHHTDEGCFQSQWKDQVAPKDGRHESNNGQILGRIIPEPQIKIKGSTKTQCSITFFQWMFQCPLCPIDITIGHNVSFVFRNILQFEQLSFTTIGIIVILLKTTH